jgi:DNA-binding PadR family transcriptional regulator
LDIINSFLRKPIHFRFEIGRKEVTDMQRYREEITSRIRQKCVRGFIDIMTLALLVDSPMCGYEIIESIYERAHVLLSPGTVYPLLDSLQRKGLIEGRTESKKKIYEITSSGRETLVRMSAEYAKIQSILSVSFSLGKKAQPTTSEPRPRSVSTDQAPRIGKTSTGECV